MLDLLGSTAAMLGDWDLQSTLLRRAIQEGALRSVAGRAAATLLVERAEQLDAFQRELLEASRGARTDCVSRFPAADRGARHRAAHGNARSGRFWLIWAALALTLGGAFCFTRGWLGAGLGPPRPSTPARPCRHRLAILRLRPLTGRMLSAGSPYGRPPACRCSRSAGGRCATGPGGAQWCRLAAACLRGSGADREAAASADADPWLLSRRNAIFAAIPFALAGSWTAYLIGLLVYARFLLRCPACAPRHRVDAKLTEIR